MSNSVAAQSGATLLEVVVASFLLSVSVAGLSTLYGQSAYVLKQAQQYQLALLFSADFWELMQAVEPPQQLQAPIVAVSCPLSRQWQDTDAFELWQQRWRCEMSQASVTLQVSAHQSALVWQGLQPSTSVPWVLGAH